ncbi:hypothetical protein [Sphaerisporangium sp. TRM90804]|uniref:hypothetical protein n=1 Tax=Sphaerisporangium sp. TRM90804 TaxID=3031113 RepID=UPI002448BAE1|nr:hypothetical protein [Sphaerisporangium sp. TRM90804]MDH2429339.1 hypothetical protein [Sphaerisporangium sp. TRM90804]
MSANQIPAPLTARRSPSTTLEHSCPECWMNGGPGHRPADVMRMLGRPTRRTR